MKVAIHQPHYFPWLGLLHKISQCDLFVFLDNVQFNRRSYQHRALYSTNQGTKYLTIPVHAPRHQIDHLLIKDIGFGEKQERIAKQHFETLRHRYASSPGWKEHVDRLHTLFFEQTDFQTPCDLIIASTVLTFETFDLDLKWLCSSTLSAGGQKGDLMLNITREVGGTTYLSGQGAREYQDEEAFAKAGVDLEYQEFVHPLYQQRHGGEFVEGAMALDLAFDDPDAAKRYAEQLRSSI